MTYQVQMCACGHPVHNGACEGTHNVTDRASVYWPGHRCDCNTPMPEPRCGAVNVLPLLFNNTEPDTQVIVRCDLPDRHVVPLHHAVHGTVEMTWPIPDDDPPF